MEKKKPGGCGLIFAIVVIALVVYFLTKDDGTKTSQPATSNTPDKIDAYLVAKEFVKDELKAPATANFGDNYTFVDNQDSTYDLAGTVDSQNSFGANLRATWRVSLRWIGGSPENYVNYKLLDIYVK